MQKTIERINKLCSGSGFFPLDGKKFRDRRLASGMTQEAVAAEADVHTNSIYNWETGSHRPYVRQALRMCVVLKCIPDAIATDEAVIEMELGK